MTVQKVDHALLMKSPVLLGRFREAIKQAIVSEAGAGLTPDRVELALSAGSVNVQVTVSPPSNVSASAMQSRLSSGAAIGQAVAARVSKLDGIAAVSTGVIRVTDVSAPTISATFRAPLVEELPSTAVSDGGLESSRTMEARGEVLLASSGNGSMGGSPGTFSELGGQRVLSPLSCEMVPQDERDSMPMPQSLVRGTLREVTGRHAVPAGLSMGTEGSPKARWDTPPMQRRPANAAPARRAEGGVHQGYGRTPPTKAVTHISPRLHGRATKPSPPKYKMGERIRDYRASPGSDKEVLSHVRAEDFAALPGGGGPYFSADEMPDDLIFFDVPNANRRQRETFYDPPPPVASRPASEPGTGTATPVGSSSARQAAPPGPGVSQPGSGGGSGGGRSGSRAGGRKTPPHSASSRRAAPGAHGSGAHKESRQAAQEARQEAQPQASLQCGWNGNEDEEQGTFRIPSDGSLDCLDFVDPRDGDTPGSLQSSTKGSRAAAGLHLSRALLKSAALNVGGLSVPPASTQRQRGLPAGGGGAQRPPKEEAPPPTLEDLQYAHTSARHRAPPAAAEPARRGSRREVAAEALQDIVAAKRSSQSVREPPPPQVVAQDASVAQGRRGSQAGRQAAPQEQRRSATAKPVEPLRGEEAAGAASGSEEAEVKEDPHKLPFPEKQRIFEAPDDAPGSPAKGSIGAAGGRRSEGPPAAKVQEEVSGGSPKASKESPQEEDSGSESDSASAEEDKEPKRSVSIAESARSSTAAAGAAPPAGRPQALRSPSGASGAGTPTRAGSVATASPAGQPQATRSPSGTGSPPARGSAASTSSAARGSAASASPAAPSQAPRSPGAAGTPPANATPPGSKAQAPATTPQPTNPRRLTESSAATSSPETDEDESDEEDGSDDASETPEKASPAEAGKPGLLRSRAMTGSKLDEVATCEKEEDGRKRASTASSKPVTESDEGESSDEGSGEDSDN